jgi:hypothetical protein
MINAARIELMRTPTPPGNFYHAGAPTASSLTGMLSF